MKKLLWLWFVILMILNITSTIIWIKTGDVGNTMFYDLSWTICFCSLVIIHTIEKYLKK
jgi:hypothetical protein